MEIEKTEQQGRDAFILLDDFLHQAKRMWLLGLALVLICAAGLTFVQRRAYRPVYEASASFTMSRVAASRSLVGSSMMRTSGCA